MKYYSKKLLLVEDNLNTITFTSDFTSLSLDIKFFNIESGKKYKISFVDTTADRPVLFSITENNSDFVELKKGESHIFLATSSSSYITVSSKNVLHFNITWTLQY